MATLLIPVVNDEGYRRLGALVRSWRKAKGLTIDELALEINERTNFHTNKSALYRLERPAMGAKPDPELLMAIAGLELIRNRDNDPYDFMDFWHVAAGHLMPNMPDKS